MIPAIITIDCIDHIDAIIDTIYTIDSINRIDRIDGIDAIDTLWIMGLKAEFLEAKELLRGFHERMMSSGALSTFECTIRILGGFLSSYYLTGDRFFLNNAKGKIAIEHRSEPLHLRFHRRSIPCPFSPDRSHLFY